MATVLPTLPAYPTVVNTRDSVRAALQFYDSLIRNYNDGGVTATYIEALSLLLGSDATSYQGVSTPGAYQNLKSIRDGAYLLTASGLALDYKAADFNTFRKPPIASSTFVVFGIQTPLIVDYTIISGSLCQAEPADPSKAPIIFQTTAQGTIAAGNLQSAPVPVTSIVAGSIGNVGVGQINAVIGGQGGLSVTNPNRSTGGTDLEGDDTPNGGLRARALAAIPNASQCTISAIVASALNYAGIVSAVLVENTDSNGNFQRGVCQLYVDDGTGNIGNLQDPNNASLQQLQIDLNAGRYRAAGVTVQAQGAVQLATFIALSIDLSNQYVVTFSTLALAVAAAQAAVGQAVFNFVNATPMGQPVKIADIVRVAKEVPGISNVIVGSVQINGVAGDLLAAPTQVPRIASLPLVTVNVAGVTSYA